MKKRQSWRQLSRNQTRGEIFNVWGGEQFKGPKVATYGRKKNSQPLKKRGKYSGQSIYPGEKNGRRTRGWIGYQGVSMNGTGAKGQDGTAKEKTKGSTREPITRVEKNSREGSKKKK